MRLEVHEGSPFLPAVVTNLSDGGAGLRVSASEELSPQFRLMFPGKGLRTCRVVWRSGENVGVEFLAEPLVAEACAA